MPELVPQALFDALASRYTIGDEIGRGGMAAVYAAHDLRHDRPVAIKVLSEDASAVRSSERFIQEIRVAARLNHPHILPLFDSGEVDGRLFFVMPLVQGESLRHRLRREGRLPIDDALRVAREISDALSYAHDSGVIHRDVKPENILLSHGHALLADFGVSRTTNGPPSETLTQVGMIVGTPEYMSPEQLVGDELGPASDIYALGCVLYEMLAGKAPHASGRLQAIMAERLTKGAPDVRSIRPEVTVSMEQGLRRALATDPADRFASARDFSTALASRAAATHQSMESARSLIVRPFDVVGDDEELAFFSDGLTEEVIGGLSKVRSLRVISRTSAMRLKGTHLDVRSIGREYEVRYVVTGSVRRSAARVRAAAEIVDSMLDAPVWAGKFDGSTDDPFGMQERVASGIVEALQVSLTPDEQRRVFARPIADPRAYECHRKAMQAIVTFDAGALHRAEALLNEGLSIVGDNAQLFAGLGALHWQYVNGGIDVSEERLSKARHWLERALAMDPEHADAHVALAWMNGSRGDIRDAILHLNRVLASDPNHSFALAFSSVVDWMAGRHEHMHEVLRRLQAIDPWELWGVVVSAVEASMRGDFPARDRHFQRAVEISPSPFVVYMQGNQLAQDQDLEAARKIWSQFAEAPADDLGVVFCQAGVAALDGRVDTVRSLLARDDVRTLMELDGQWGWFAASTYAMAGMRDEGIAQLNTAIRQGFTNVLLIESRDATLASLREHPRFPEVLLRARRALTNLEQELGTSA